MSYLSKRFSSVFIYSASGVLLISGLAKLLSAFGSSRVLHVPDPILQIEFRYVFWIVGTVELLVALFCLFGKRENLKIGLIACLAANFLIYRAGLAIIGWEKPCSCLGNLTDALHLAPGAADLAMKVILAYLLGGSLVLLFLSPSSQKSLCEKSL
jgi:hypothetical protein